LYILLQQSSMLPEPIHTSLEQPSLQEFTSLLEIFCLKCCYFTQITGKSLQGCMLDSVLGFHAIHGEVWWLPLPKAVAETGEFFSKHCTKMLP